MSLTLSVRCTRLLAALAAPFIFASCGGTDALPFPVPAEDGDLVVLFVSEAGTVVDAVTYVQGDPPESIAVSDGQRVHAAVLKNEQLVDAAGQRLDRGALQAAKVSMTVDGGDCGRCVRGPYDAPWSVVSGESCPVPRFAAIASDNVEDEVRALLRSVFISWPGSCACTPLLRPMNPAPLEWSYVAPSEAPLSHVVGTSSSTMLVGLQRAEHHSSTGEPEVLGQAELPFSGPINGVLRLSDGDFLVASAPVLQSEARDTLYRFASGIGGFEYRPGQDFPLFGGEGDPGFKVARLFRLSNTSYLILGTEGNSTAGIARRQESLNAPLEIWVDRGATVQGPNEVLGSGVLDADWLSDGRLIFMGQKGFAVTSTFTEGSVPEIFGFAHSDAAGPDGKSLAVLGSTPGSQKVVGCLQGNQGSSLIVASVGPDSRSLTVSNPMLTTTALCAGFSSVLGAPDSARAAFSDGTSVVVNGDGSVSGGLETTTLEGVTDLATGVRRLEDDHEGSTFAWTRSGAVYARYAGAASFTLVKASPTASVGGVIELVTRSDDVVAVFANAVRALPGGASTALLDSSAAIEAAAWDSGSNQLIVAYSSGSVTRLGVLDPELGSIEAFGPALDASVRRIGAVGPARYVALGTDGCLFVVSGDDTLAVSIEADDPSTGADMPFDFLAECGMQSQDVFRGLATSSGTAWISGVQDMLLRLETWSSPLVARRYSLQRLEGLKAPKRPIEALSVSCPDDLTVIAPQDPLGAAFAVHSGECSDPRLGLCPLSLESVSSVSSPGRPIDVACTDERCVVAHGRALRSVDARDSLDVRWFDGFVLRVAANPEGGFVAGDTDGRILQSN